MAAKATTAAGKAKPSTRRGRRKGARTEVFDSSSSSSEVSSSESESASSSEAKPAASKKTKKQKASPPTASSSSTPASKSTDADNGVSMSDASPSPSDASSSASSSDASSSVPTPLPPSFAAAAFPSWYLRTVTQELAEDLDKVRNAPDFRDAALPLLVHALQQGEAAFSDAEKARVMTAGEDVEST